MTAEPVPRRLAVHEVSCYLPRFMKNILLAVWLLSSLAWAQARPEEGGHEFQVWTGGGHSVPGGTADTGVWNVGARYGWILTDPILPGPLRGRFEFAVDVVPVFLVVQRTGTAYGFGLNPFALKWNFVPRHGVAPYVDLGGGTLIWSDWNTK